MTILKDYCGSYVDNNKNDADNIALNGVTNNSNNNVRNSKPNRMSLV